MLRLATIGARMRTLKIHHNAALSLSCLRQLSRVLIELKVLWVHACDKFDGAALVELMNDPRGFPELESFQCDGGQHLQSLTRTFANPVIGTEFV